MEILVVDDELAIRKGLAAMLEVAGYSVRTARDGIAALGAVRNNPDKFPAGFVFQLNSLELKNWKSKILTSNLSEEELLSVKMGMRKLPYAFTERGLYMLATILKGRAATRATLAIVDTYARVRKRNRNADGSCVSPGRDLRACAEKL